MLLSKKIGMVLRTRRLSMKMTQMDLAVAAKTDRSFISDIENGKKNISVNMLERLCAALDVEAWWVVKTAGNLK